MSIFLIKRHLRRRWKRWRRAIWTVGLCSLFLGLASLGLSLSHQVETLMTQSKPLAIATLGSLRQQEEPLTNRNFQKELQIADIPRMVHLRKIYACGEEEQVIGLRRSVEILQMQNTHLNWNGRIDDKGQVWFEEHINDISQSCKQKGFLGIDHQGNLSLFEGPPKEKKVIRTFFQLDVETMVSTLPKEVIDELHSGIRVRDLEEYNSVISTFSDYAVERAQRVMKESS